MPLVPQIVDAVGVRCPSSPPAESSMVAASRTISGSVRGSSPRPRHVVSGYREALVDDREDDTVITPAYTGKTRSVDPWATAPCTSEPHPNGSRRSLRTPASTHPPLRELGENLGVALGEVTLPNERCDTGNALVGLRHCAGEEVP